MTPKRISVLLAFVLLLAACTSFQANRITIGQSILDLGDQFLSTGKLYDKALTEGVITRDQYNTFAEFAGYFKPAYLGMVKTYEAGTASPEELRRVIRELNDELALYALSQIKK